MRAQDGFRHFSGHGSDIAQEDTARGLQRWTSYFSCSSKLFQGIPEPFPGAPRAMSRSAPSYVQEKPEVCPFAPSRANVGLFGSHVMLKRSEPFLNHVCVDWKPFRAVSKPCFRDPETIQNCFQIMLPRTGNCSEPFPNHVSANQICSEPFTNYVCATRKPFTTISRPCDTRIETNLLPHMGKVE